MYEISFKSIPIPMQSKLYHPAHLGAIYSDKYSWDSTEDCCDDGTEECWDAGVLSRPEVISGRYRSSILGITNTFWNSYCSFFSIHSVTCVSVTSLSPSIGRTWRSNCGGTWKLYLEGQNKATSRNNIRVHGNTVSTTDQYHILSVGGGGMLMARVPDSSWTSTLSIKGMLDTSAIFFLMYSFSVAFWKYLDFAILSTNLRIFLPVLFPL